MSPAFKRSAPSRWRGFVRSVAAAILLTPGMAGAAAQEQSGDIALFEAIRQADLKVASIGWRLASANAPLCDQIEAGFGFQLHTLDQFDPAQRAAARAHFGFETRVAIEAVIAGSPAERAQLKPDDSLVQVGTVMIADVAGRPDSTERMVAAQMAIAALSPNEPVQVVALRAGQTIRVTLQPVPVCKSRFEMRIARDWGASADGSMVQISSRLIEEYTEDQIAGVMAHELAHNVLRHRVRLEARGASFGMLSGFGANVKYFRQTELQADLLSVYLLGNAGYPLHASTDFWRRFGPSKAGGILRSRSHPAWRDRVATLEAEIAKAETISARPMIPAILAERDRPLDGNWQALLIRHR